MKYYNEGLSDKEIAVKMNKSDYAIRMQREMGIKLGKELLKYLTTELTNLDFAVKTGEGEARTLLDIFIARVMTKI
jgi:hypothetical protein